MTVSERKKNSYSNGIGGDNISLFPDSRQRNEAIGLLILGSSAFCITLLHYATASQSYTTIQGTMVNIGMGVYILPSLTGILGIQKFLDKPFNNVWWRIGGCLGTTVSVLGLLGTEGGKLGVKTFTSLSTLFGNIPTYIILITAFITSMIFALDILYKDVLAWSLIAAGIATKILLCIWNFIVSMVSMAIRAVKTTGEFIGVIVNRLSIVYKERFSGDNSTFSNLSNIISFNKSSKSNNENDEEITNVVESVAINKEENHIEAEEATIVESVEEAKQEVNNDFVNQITVAAVSGITVATASTLTSVSIENTETPVPLPSTEDKESQNFQETNENKQEQTLAKIVCEAENNVSHEPKIIPVVKIITPVKQEEEINEKKEIHETTETILHDSIIQPIAKPDKVEEEKTEEDKPEVMIINTINATKKPTESIYLDDNPIDKEIKNLELLEAESNKEELVAKLPIPEEILKMPKPRNTNDIKVDLENRSIELIQTLNDFGIKATITDVVYGPAISRFELKPAPGIKVSRITSLSDDMALALSAQSIRIEAPIPGKPAIGIEIPNKEPTPVYFYDLVHNDKFVNSPVLLNIALGQTINGQAVYADLADMPHLLIAGSTGSGKSVCVNTIIASILFRARADQVKFIMIDPKMVELSSYNGIPHMIAPVVTDPQKAGDALLWAQEEMTRRYTLLAECGCKKLESYNERLEELRQEINPALEKLPLIVIVIDELADLMMTARDKVETTICRLAQMARAVGIHLIIATQRPSVDVLTGLIKANLPTRIAFSVASAVDSKTILDSKGAEKLIGKGDMLFIPKGRNKPLRVQGAFVSDGELKKLVDFVKTQGKPEYVDIQPIKTDDDDEDDDIHEEIPVDSDAELITRIVNYLETQEKTSTSMLQRKFRIGYNRAARIMDQLEEKGMVTPTDGSNKRRVLIGRSISQL